MKTYSSVSSVLVALAVMLGTQVRADNMASIGITPATGVVTLVPRWSIGGNLGGFHFMAQDLSLTGGAANEFYSIKNTAIPAGGDITAFTFYVPGSGAATNHVDIGSKLTPNSYGALTSADPDVGYGSVQFYFIHHKADGDYFSHIVPSSAVASAVTDLKPMSQPGGPATGGASGYFGLTFASANLGYGLNMFYYLRTDPLTGTTKFGALPPGLAGAPADQFDLRVTGHSAIAFVGTDVGYGFNKMYYTRLDSITGFTILGTLDPVSGRVADIANLGSVYTTLTYVPGDIGYGPGKFYTTGSVNPTWQSVSFAAIADRLMSEGSFSVNPTASSALPIALTVVTGSATISSPVGGVFTVTPTAPGLITLQATQAGQSGAFEANMLRQSFTVNTIAPSSRLVNFSARATSGPGAATLIMGFVVSGSGKNLLVRGVGPTLSNYGVVNSLADPMLTVFGPSGAIAVNDDWQTPMTQPSGSPAAASGSVLASTAAQVGAFALPSGSKDSALLITVSNIILSTSFARANATTGVALTEIYDTDTVLGSRLVNVSARMNVSAGEGTLIAGFVIFGNAPKTVLIRGVGPTLANYSVTGVLADPAITVYASGSLMASNDNWEVGNSTPTQLINASAAVGAFALPTGSKDAALLLTLQPGIYSVHVTGVGNTTGVALVEVYDTQ